MLFVFFFFFKQKTAYEMRISDWSSDVCSSDLHYARIFSTKKAAPGAVFKAGSYWPSNPRRSVGAQYLDDVSHGPRGIGGAAGEIGRASCRERVCQYV